MDPQNLPEPAALESRLSDGAEHEIRGQISEKQLLFIIIIILLPT